MADWKDDKDLGPFDFTEQPNKWGYLNNPRWTTSPEPGNEHNYTGREDEEPQIWDITQTPVSGENTPHIPCGHWHKKSNTPITYIYDIFGLFETGGGAIYGVSFNGSSLSYLGMYDAADDCNGLVVYGSDLLTMGGNGASAELQIIGTTPESEVLPLLSTVDVLNSYDVMASGEGRIVYDSTNDKYIYFEGHSTNAGGRIIPLDSDLARLGRYFVGTVVTGTDGNLYIPDYVYSTWVDSKRPITGGYWTSYFTIIPDNISDTPVTTWGDGTLYTNVGIGTSGQVYGNSLYIAMPDSPYGRFRKYSLTTFAIEAANNNTTYDPFEFCFYGGSLYSIGGFNSSAVVKYNVNTLVAEDTLLMPDGRYGDIIVSGNYLYALTWPYTGDAGFYKIDPITFTIIDTLFLSGPEILWQKIERIDDDFIVLGGNTNVGVVNINTMTIIDTVDVYRSTAFATKELVVIQKIV